jgi:hypothetical protein
MVVAPFAFLLPSPASASSVTLRVGTAEVAPGATVEVPLEIAGGTGIGAIHVEVTYDPAVVRAEGATKAALLGDQAMLDSNATTPGRLVVGVISLADIQGSGPIATLRFTAVGGGGAQTALGLENVSAWEGQSHQDVLVTTQPGQLMVTGGNLLLWVLLAVAALLLLLLVILLGVWISRRGSPGRP